MSRLFVRFAADLPCEQPCNLPNPVNVELIDFIERKCVDAGYNDVSSLAKAFRSANPTKLIRNLQEFGKTSNLQPEYLEKLIKIINLDASEIDDIQRRHRDKLYEEKNRFLHNFDLMLDNTDVILADPRYRNIIFYGLYISTAWVGRNRPVTIGELLFHYRNGDFILPECCGSAYLISGGCSVLSGCNNYEGFCRTCKKRVYGSSEFFSAKVSGPYFKNPPPFPYEPTDYTVRQLVEDFEEEETQSDSGVASEEHNMQ